MLAHLHNLVGLTLSCVMMLYGNMGMVTAETTPSASTATEKAKVALIFGYLGSNYQGLQVRRPRRGCPPPSTAGRVESPVRG